MLNVHRKHEELTMPYLRLDASARYPLQTKRELALRIANLYAEIMQTTPDLVAVGFCDLGEGAVWLGDKHEPLPAAILSCAIRRGRPPEQRARLADALVTACTEVLGLDPTKLVVEFSYHAGDDIYRKAMVNGVLRGALGRDWSPDEMKTPLMETMIKAASDGTLATL
jgi:phenylpyruvate tautomerase PptA (4-oxalocrotonate tautomerase family)